jgi:hypothetical protein
MFTIEVIIKKGLDTQEMKDWIWNKAGQMPVVDGTHYRIKLDCSTIDIASVLFSL